MHTGGQHLLLDLWLNEDISAEKVENIFQIVRTQFSVVQECHHPFTPQGLTSVLILSESHFTIHTYPEHKYLSIDLYICNFITDLRAFAKEIQGLFNVKHVKLQHHLRGQLLPNDLAAPNYFKDIEQ